MVGKKTEKGREGTDRAREQERKIGRGEGRVRGR